MFRSSVVLVLYVPTDLYLVVVNVSRCLPDVGNTTLLLCVCIMRDVRVLYTAPLYNTVPYAMFIVPTLTS